VTDPHGNIYAQCPDFPGTCAAAPYFLVSPLAYRLESEASGPPADLHGTGLAIVMMAGLYPKDSRPVARCPRHGGALVAMAPDGP
jgi:hypothetical protein